MNVSSANVMASMADEFSSNRMTLGERLALLGLIDETSSGPDDLPGATDMFKQLGDLLDQTVRGAKVDRLKSDRSHRGFKILEINAETGENLGRLNMLYLNKPVPCYYLVYVEVAAPFRNKGLGNRILEAFRDFLTEKSAIGILDNIIPPDDPTYDIYVKLDWKPANDLTQPAGNDQDGFYMVYTPPSLPWADMKDRVVKLIHHLRRKRAAIDMRDNELMVERTIAEFKDLYDALVLHFAEMLVENRPSPIMRFLFTRFVTKLLGFRRRIRQLLGYTGGESLSQIKLHPEVRALRVQSYAPGDSAGAPSLECGDKQMWLNLCEDFKNNPARTIEALPNYRRPNLVNWMQANNISSSDPLTIGDLMDLGFDPTRLKEISIGGRDYVFERIQARMLDRLKRKKEVLDELRSQVAGTRVRKAMVHVNPPVLVIRDRGNGYVLRPRVEGIHWEEAVEQLQTVDRHRELNRSMRLDKLITSTVRRCSEWVGARLEPEDRPLLDDLTYFVPWDLQSCQPRVAVDMASPYLESIWIA